jgi:hypothetical protein
MKANQVYNFSTGFKFPQNFLLMNYKLNKTHNHTWKSNADLSRINSWGHKLYINTVRHVTGTGSGLLGGIPRVVVQISALTLKGPL